MPPRDRRKIVSIPLPGWRARSTTSTDVIVLPPAVFLELEIGGGQALDGLPVPAGHADGNLDDGHPRVLADGARAVALGEEKARAGTDSNRAGTSACAPSKPLHRAAFPASNFRARAMSAAKRPGGAVFTEALEGRPAESRVSCSSATTPRFSIASNCCGSSAIARCQQSTASACRPSRSSAAPVPFQARGSRSFKAKAFWKAAIASVGRSCCTYVSPMFWYEIAFPGSTASALWKAAIASGTLPAVAQGDAERVQDVGIAAAGKGLQNRERLAGFSLCAVEESQARGQALAQEPAPLRLLEGRGRLRRPYRPGPGGRRGTRTRSTSPGAGGRRRARARSPPRASLLVEAHDALEVGVEGDQFLRIVLRAIALLCRGAPGEVPEAAQARDRVRRLRDGSRRRSGNRQSGLQRAHLVHPLFDEVVRFAGIGGEVVELRQRQVDELESPWIIPRRGAQPRESVAESASK